MKTRKKMDKEKRNRVVRAALTKYGILPADVDPMRRPITIAEMKRFCQHFGKTAELERHRSKEEKILYVYNYIKEHNLLLLVKESAIKKMCIV